MPKLSKLTLAKLPDLTLLMVPKLKPKEQPLGMILDQDLDKLFARSSWAVSRMVSPMMTSESTLANSEVLFKLNR